MSCLSCSSPEFVHVRRGKERKKNIVCFVILEISRTPQPKHLKNFYRHKLQLFLLSSLGSMQYRVRMTDFLEDEGGTPIFDVVSWNNMRAIPPKITAAMIPSLGGVFFLRDPDDVSTCCHVVVSSFPFPIT